MDLIVREIHCDFESFIVGLGYKRMVINEAIKNVGIFYYDSEISQVKIPSFTNLRLNLIWIDIMTNIKIGFDQVDYSRLPGAIRASEKSESSASKIR